jgi:hypothetical protein
LVHEKCIKGAQKPALMAGFCGYCASRLEEAEEIVEEVSNRVKYLAYPPV